MVTNGANGHSAAAVIEVPDRWVELQEPLQDALKRTGVRYSARDVFEQIITQQAQWWPGEASVVVTKLFSDGNDLILLYWLAGGELAELQEMEKEISQAAAERGATIARIYGRRGWLNVLDGFEEISVTMERRLGD